MASASILVVDDDAPFRAAVCRALRAEGHAVEEATDGTQAMRIVAADTPDIVITDIYMPNGDGIELITAVKGGFPTVRILAISGHGSLGVVNMLNMAAQLGADATLAKPLSPEQLLEKVAELVGQGRGASA